MTLAPRRLAHRLYRDLIKNPYRWLTNGSYRRARRFFKAGGNELLYSIALPPGAAVIEAGAYKGEFSDFITRRWDAHVWAFEPVETFRLEAETRLAGRRVTLMPFGLWSRDSTSMLTLDGDASSAFVDSSTTAIPVSFRDASVVFSELGLDRIDMLAINIEGAEYDLLDRLIETGWLSRVDHLVVQFHPFVSGYRRRYRAVVRALSRTHRCVWRFPWVWEHWAKI